MAPPRPEIEPGWVALPECARAAGIPRTRLYDRALAAGLELRFTTINHLRVVLLPAGPAAALAGEIAAARALGRSRVYWHDEARPGRPTTCRARAPGATPPAPPRYQLWGSMTDAEKVALYVREWKVIRRRHAAQALRRRQEAA